jgi:hypothetical protein
MRLSLPTSTKTTFPPRGVVIPTAFFVASGLLDGALSAMAARPVDLDTAWTIVGRSLMSLIVAFGLWQRMALCRTIALVYCLASVTTYVAALALALAREPLAFPMTVVVGSAFEVPSCVLLFLYLRSPRAAALYDRPVF